MFLLNQDREIPIISSQAQVIILQEKRYQQLAQTQYGEHFMAGYRNKVVGWEIIFITLSWILC